MTDVNLPEITIVDLTDGSTSIRGPRGAAIILGVRRGEVIRVQFIGHLVGAMMAKMLSAVELAFAPDAAFSLAIDAEAQSGYEPEVRSLATAWLLRNRNRLRTMHLLSRTPMVKMGTQMLNLSLGNNVFKLYHDRGEFERGVAKVGDESEGQRPSRRWLER
jgi:hypothetical protein